MSRPSTVRDRRDKWDIRLQSYIGSAIRSLVGIRSSSPISSSSSGQCSDGKYFATNCIFGLANVGQFSGLMSVLSHVPWLWPANGTAPLPPPAHSSSRLLTQFCLISAVIPQIFVTLHDMIYDGRICCLTWHAHRSPLGIN